MIQVGEQLQGKNGSYQVEQILHAAGQMLTARAIDQASGAPVVLKQLRIEMLQSWKVLELFERETGVMQQLDHPYLPRFIDAFQSQTETDTCLYLVCSWAEGESLLDKLEAGWRPDTAQVWEIARQTLELLDYLHSFHPPIIHRDLKPGNLILDPQEQIHLVDLGAVQAVLNPDGGSTVVGTFGYMPPEQFNDQCVPASDLYALASSLVHLLTGKYPSDLPRKGMKLDYAGLVKLDPAQLVWLDKLLDPIVEKRFATAKEALAALDQSQDRARTGQTETRIQTLARGTGLKITIQPVGWVRGLGWPAVWSPFLFVWGLGSMLNVFSSFEFGYYSFSDQMIELLLWQNFFNYLLMGTGLGVLFRRLIYSRITTVLQLQPDRYVIRHSLGRLRRSFEGGSSELHRLERRFSLGRMAWATRLIERSELSRLAVQNLNDAETRQLATMISQYLKGLDPAQAKSFLGQTLDPPLKGLSQDLALGNDKRVGLELWLSSTWRRGCKWVLQKLPSGLPAPDQRLPDQRLPGQSRVRVERNAQGLTLQIGPRWLSARWAALLTLWSSWNLHMMSDWGLLSSNRYSGVNNLVYYLFYDASFQLSFSIYGLINLLAARYFLHRLFASQSRSSLSISGDNYSFKLRLWFWQQTHTGQLSQLQDLKILRHPLHKRGDLQLTPRDGQPLPLASWLSYQDQADLSETLNEELGPHALPPLITASLDEMQARSQRWQQNAFGRQDRLQLAPAAPGKKHQQVLEVLPAQLTGSLLRRQLLGSGFLLMGTGSTWLMLKLAEGLLSPYRKMLPFYPELLSGLEQVTQLAWLCVSTPTAWGINLIGLCLMLNSYFLAKVQTTLVLTEDQIKIQHRFGRWHWQHMATLSPQLSLKSKNLSMRLRFKVPRQASQTLAYGLNPASNQALSAQLKAWSQTSQTLPAAAPGSTLPSDSERPSGSAPAPLPASQALPAARFGARFWQSARARQKPLAVPEQPEA
ncbi:MAG: hypothetical protein CVV27_04970 [Candidatus Melainabacteria bacterium HGW-Melainabacteria-1]|nr:MAG: hypothetical protein CVV27_04970 [Candidatus Melainabacteria bacterium HGW-Melainabacteria-1]